ncbi:MAG: TetR family transcriptional regulator [Candidatus Eremiobacteraeota bacterium]|nr:TetR family transcriptional regulator [Candidatus Eremiobacteraeota bacterium]
MAEAGEEARISRRTAYRYFPSQEQLLSEAALELLRPEIESSYGGATDPEMRVDALVRAMHERTAEHEDLLRTIIRHTVQRAGEAERKGSVPLRGRRRIDWIEGALAPARRSLPSRAFERLVSAVSLCVGAEALIVLRDVRGLDPKAVSDVSRWAARALVRAALADAAQKPVKRKTSRKH